MTVNDALNRAAETLEAAGVEGPRITAELLMAHLLGTGRPGVYTRLKEELDDPAAGEFFGYVKRRAAREPLQHITGRQEFFGLEFIVTPDTLVPRPETELVVAEALRTVEGVESPLAADIGTGSGCIAVSLAKGAPGLTVYATDVSGAALDVAKKNAARHGVAERVRFLGGDLFGPLDGMGLAGRLDIVVSNPPYIPSAELPGLQPEAGHDPAGALGGGPDGLCVVRRILVDAPAFMKPGGTLIMEIGAGQSGPVRRLVEQSGGLRVKRFLQDFSGIERVLVAEKL